MSYRFQAVNSSSSQTGLITQINRNFAVLDAEAVSKQFKGSNGVTHTTGVFQDGRIGTLIEKDGTPIRFDGLYDGTHEGTLRYDSNGVPIRLDGQAPDDGRQGAWIVKSGKNVLTELGG